MPQSFRILYAANIGRVQLQCQRVSQRSEKVTDPWVATKDCLLEIRPNSPLPCSGWFVRLRWPDREHFEYKYRCTEYEYEYDYSSDGRIMTYLPLHIDVRSVRDLLPQY